MAISVYPTVVSSGGAGADAKYAITAGVAQEEYVIDVVLPPGIYQIDNSPTSAVVTVNFVNDATELEVQSSTISGQSLVSLASEAAQIYIRSSLANVEVTFGRIAQEIAKTGVSGTLDTITNTSTYNQTGKLLVMCVGGGGGGTAGRGNPSPGAPGTAGGGGASGSVVSRVVYTNSPTSVTIGAAGNAGTVNDWNNTNAGGVGGTTSFGNKVSAVGGPGGVPVATGGAAPLGGGKGGNQGTPGEASQIRFSINTNSTTGGGGGGNGGSGAGSGIGTGGNGPGGGGAGNVGNGYGAGGGGGGFGNGPNPGGSGAAGTAGVVYVLRGIS